MSVAWVELDDAELDDAEAEDAELEWAEYDEGDGELYDDSESDDSEESRAAARRKRQAQQRRVANARRRQATARSRAKPKTPRPGKAVTRPAPQRKAAAAIRNLDLETKVQDDRLRAAITAQGKRMSRAEYASVVGAATNQFMESFDGPDNPYLKAGLRFAPLLLLSPQKRGTGFESVVRDPRVIGAAAVAAITFAGDSRKRGSEAQGIGIQSSAELTAEDKDMFFAEVTDGRGRAISKRVTWRSENPTVATINPETGDVEAKTPGTAILTATVDNIVRQVRLKVNPKP